MRRTERERKGGPDARSDRIRKGKSGPKETAPTEADWKRLLWPIAKRLPSYVRLVWALIRDPAIPQRKKILLYSALLYSVSPLTMVLGVVPLVGQLDGVILLLLGIRQTLRNCPPGVAERHLARFHMNPTQVSEDLNTCGAVLKQAVKAVATPVGRNTRFAGRVAAGFGRRMLQRLAAEPAPRRRRIR